MRRNLQLNLLKSKDFKLKHFGGAYLKGNPRFQRPVSVKRSMHLVMKSSMAKGSLSFLNPIRAKRIELTIKTQAKRVGVRIYRYANAGNHLHLVVKTPSRQAFRHFIRASAGLIARLTTGIQKGAKLGKKFWDARPFTRIVEWGRDYLVVSRYVQQNTLEALGFIAYKPRTTAPGP